MTEVKKGLPFCKLTCVGSIFLLLWVFANQVHAAAVTNNKISSRPESKFRAEMEVTVENSERKKPRETRAGGLLLLR